MKGQLSMATTMFGASTGADGGPENRQNPKIPHYYGDVVRVLFLIGALIMLAMEPFFSDQIPISTPLSLIIITILVLVAGFTSPRFRFRWIIMCEVFISTIAVIAFGYVGVLAYLRHGGQDLFFWTNEILAIMFLVALYFSAKTVRNMPSQ